MRLILNLNARNKNAFYEFLGRMSSFNWKLRKQRKRGSMPEKKSAQAKRGSLFFGIEHIRCRAHLGSRWESLSAYFSF